ncbi:Uncharacterised protein [Mycobacterium tuberculosis]|nr:Uncharacterised protein [Mycobacterium tuberculosis]CKT48516.1 Uncharacterised protein [Mycobacterium tuberculosis]
MHGDPHDLHLTELGKHRPDRFCRRTAHPAGDHHDLSPIELALDDFAKFRRVVADDANPVHLRTGIPARRSQGIGVDVINLPVARGPRDVDQLAPDGHHRQPRTRVHQHPFTADRRQQPHLGCADDRPRAHRHITGLHVVARTPHVGARRRPAQHPHPRHSAIGPPQRQDRIGQGGKRRAGLHPDRLARLQPAQGARSGFDGSHHR